jgi:hypothetical protein
MKEENKDNATEKKIADLEKDISGLEERMGISEREGLYVNYLFMKSELDKKKVKLQANKDRLKTRSIGIEEHTYPWGTGLSR